MGKVMMVSDRARLRAVKLMGVDGLVDYHDHVHELMHMPQAFDRVHVRAAMWHKHFGCSILMGSPRWVERYIGLASTKVVERWVKRGWATRDEMGWCKASDVVTSGVQKGIYDLTK